LIRGSTWRVFYHWEIIVIFGRKHYLIVALGYLIVWKCLVCPLVAVFHNLSEIFKRVLLWFRKKKAVL
jgi:hypothetical protein